MLGGARAGVLGTLLGALALTGCAAVHRLPVSERAIGDAVFDARKGWGGFPLARGAASPRTIAELAEALATGYREGLELPEGAEPVRILGDELGAIDELLVDVSGASVARTYTPSRLGSDATPELVIRANRVDYRAKPLLFDGSVIDLRFRANDATLLLLRDRKGRSGLVISGARDGSVEFQASREEFGKAVLAVLRRRAAKLGASIEAAEVDLRSLGPRSLAVVIDARGQWLLLPLRFRLRGRMDVDERFVAAFTDVRCDGEDLGGSLAAAFLEPKLARTEQKLNPLMAFHDPATRVTALDLDARDGLAMRIAFGRGP